MKIQICSDLHLEFNKNRNWLRENPLIPKGDILIIAGDTFYLDRNFSELVFLQQASKDFEQVYLLPGNHEYYGGYDVSTALKPVFEKIFDNVSLVNNQTIEIDNILLIFSTLWSKIEHNIPAIVKFMTDFHRIQFQGEKFTTDQFNQLHEVAFDFLSNEVKKEGKKVVITHHLPSKECNSEEFKGSPLNDAFCVDKTNFILHHDIDFWIYGHSHRNLSDFKIGDTMMVTNQLGYVNWKEHKYFSTEKIIEIV